MAVDLAVAGELSEILVGAFRPEDFIVTGWKIWKFRGFGKYVNFVVWFYIEIAARVVVLHASTISS